MTKFRLTQITDTHLSRRYPAFTDNFHRVGEYIDATRPDLVVNSGDLGFDGYDHPDDLAFARAQHDALPVPCRYLPGNHDIGDNPTAVGAPPDPTGLRGETADLQLAVRRRPLAVRGRRLEFHRPEFADHEHGRWHARRNSSTGWPNNSPACTDGRWRCSSTSRCS